MHPNPSPPVSTPKFNYIVTFKEVAPSRHLNLLNKKLKLVEKEKPRPGTTLLASEDGKKRAHYHEKLAMASMHLQPEEVALLLSDEHVLSIHPNRQVRIAGANPSRHDSTRFAPYLKGFKDCLELLSGQLDGPSATTQPSATLGNGAAPSFAAARERTFVGSDPDEWSWSLRMIGVDPGYSKATGKGVKVAVLDTGIDLDHPDFAGRFATLVNTESFIDGESVDDGHGHGTHVAGIIAGAANSSGGIRYSVAPNVTLLVGKVLANNGYAFEDSILSGIAWASSMNAQVINLSLSIRRQLDAWFDWDYEVLAQRVAEAATPAILIAAAGNDSHREYDPPALAPVSNPAAAPSIVSVAACDVDLQPGDFSNAELDTVGHLDVTGPGVEVYSAYNNGSFTRLSGTSMAAPHVSGLAALRLELNPNLSPAALRTALLESVKRAPAPAPRRDYGQGIVVAP